MSFPHGMSFSHSLMTPHEKKISTEGTRSRRLIAAEQDPSLRVLS